MTDAPETMDAMIVKLAVNSARVEERKACAEMRDDYRDLMRAAHALCAPYPGAANWPEFAELWELCKDFKETP